MDGALAASGVASPVNFTPPDAASHAYHVRLVDTVCPRSADSSVQSVADAGAVLGPPTALVITDVEPCAVSEARINFTHPGFAGAGHYELFRDGLVFVTPIASGALFTPGDLLSHRYAVRAVDEVCSLTADSAELVYSDGQCLPIGEPRIFLVKGAASETRFVWDPASGPVASYNLYSGTLASLHGPGLYDHQKTLTGASFPDSPSPGDGCDVAGGPLTTARALDVPAGTYFLLVGADAALREGPYGKSWDGVRDVHDPGIDPRPASFFCP
jgi:hypothetical protein